MSSQDNLNSASRKAYGLTRSVAAIYRTLGASVEEEVSLAGSQIDLLVTLKDAEGGSIRCAVECKAYGKLVGLKTVMRFYALVQLLRARALVDKAVLISINGFTANALNFGRANQIDLIKLSELQNELRGREQELIKHVEAGFEGE